MGSNWYTGAMINVSETAAAKISELLVEEQKAGGGLRVFVQGGSCSGVAAQGRSFYTVPGDHLYCPIGSYTHAIDLPPERAGELEQTLALMTSVGYVRMEEVPAIPRLPRTPAFTYYAPLAMTVVD